MKQTGAKQEDKMSRQSLRVPASLIALSVVVGAVAASTDAHLLRHTLALTASSSSSKSLGWARPLRGSQQLEGPADLMGQHAYQLLAPLRGGAVGTMKKENKGGEEGIRCRLKKGGMEMEVRRPTTSAGVLIYRMTDVVSE